MRTARRWAGAAVLALVASGCGNLLLPDPPPGRAVEDFEAAWSFIDSVYPMLPEKGIDWDSAHAGYRARAEAARGDDIQQILHDLVETLRDGHAYYAARGGGPVFPYLSHRLRRDRSTFSPYLVRRYVDAALVVAGNGSMEHSLLDGDLGYLRLATFERVRMVDELPAVMASRAGTSGLVLDIRNNNGGELENVAGTVRWFLDSTLRWPAAFTRSGPWEDYEPPIEPVSPVSPGARYRKPVVVLANGATRSAGDMMAELMRHLPRVTLVGDTTMGIACQDHEDIEGDLRLPRGLQIHIPTGCIRGYDGVPVEWFGVPPDVRVTQTEADLRAGRDRQLEAAIALLREQTGGATASPIPAEGGGRR
jgi:C-terminal processing protease CtpA/Prc